jgi:hypothetical protein
VVTVSAAAVTAGRREGRLGSQGFPPLGCSRRRGSRRQSSSSGRRFMIWLKKLGETACRRGSGCPHPVDGDSLGAAVPALRRF